MSGDYGKSIIVTSNDPQNTSVTLTCKGKVLVPFKSKPPMVNFRGMDEAATPLPQIVSIERGDGGPLQLEVAGTGAPGIAAQLREIKAGERYELIIGLEPPQKPGKLASWVRLKTGVSEVAETTVPVYADIPAGWAGS